jgi:hypothetical protein
MLISSDCPIVCFLFDSKASDVSFLQSCDSVPHNGVVDDNIKIWTGEDLVNPVITAVQVVQSLASSVLVLTFISSDCLRICCLFNSKANDVSFLQSCESVPHTAGFVDDNSNHWTTDVLTTPVYVVTAVQVAQSSCTIPFVVDNLVLTGSVILLHHLC